MNETTAGITTLPGHEIDFDCPSPAAISLHDVSRALSRLPRWLGHTDRVWSVAEHCILVSQLVAPEFKLAALLHDGAEAYTGDVPTPLKRKLGDKFADIESRLLGAICVALGTDRLVLDVTEKDDAGQVWRPFIPFQVWNADRVALEVEEYWLRTGGRGENPHPHVPPLRPLNNPEQIAALYERLYAKAYDFAMNWKWRKVTA